MNLTTIRSFVSESLAIQAGDEAPADYLATKLAAAAKFPGLKIASQVGLPGLPSTSHGMLGQPPTAVSNQIKNHLSPPRLGAGLKVAGLAGVGTWMKNNGPNLAHAAELGGLGVLAKPSIDEMRGKEVDPRRKARTELAGLGMLAAPSAISLGRHLTGH